MEKTLISVAINNKQIASTRPYSRFPSANPNDDCWKISLNFNAMKINETDPTAPQANDAPAYFLPPMLKPAPKTAHNTVIAASEVKSVFKPIGRWS
jgi:hypothetical protein